MNMHPLYAGQKSITYEHVTAFVLVMHIQFWRCTCLKTGLVPFACCLLDRHSWPEWRLFTGTWFFLCGAGLLSQPRDARMLC